MATTLTTNEANSPPGDWPHPIYVACPLCHAIVMLEGVYADECVVCPFCMEFGALYPIWERLEWEPLEEQACDA